MRWARVIANYLSTFGLDVRRVVALRHAPKFVRDSWTYARRLDAASFPFSVRDVMPILSDLDAEAGETRGHYFGQDLWAARRIFRARPAWHLDIGSRLDGFVAHLLVFMPVTVVDVRPLSSAVDGLTFLNGDSTDLRAVATGSVESLSSLHAVEHFGLGRYGDPIDPHAWRKAIDEFARILKPGGRLYFSVPIGRQRVEFNAHRIFHPRTVLTAFASLQLVAFSAVLEDGTFIADADLDGFSNHEYACGLFEFTKS